MRIKLAVVLFWICTGVYAADESNIGKWAHKVLMETFSASYKDTPADIKAEQRNYLAYAWGPMHQFFLDKRTTINERQLTLHPVALTSPSVTESNDCQFSPCWQVTESFNIPELSLKVDVLLRVIPGSMVRTATTPYIIQSLSLKLHED